MGRRENGLNFDAVKRLVLICLIFSMAVLLQKSYADDDSTFPFDKPCLTYDKANFKVGPVLLEVIKGNDFPQYCVLYSLSDYRVKQKMEGGYFIAGSKSGPQQADATTVFLKTDKSYQQNLVLAGHNAEASKPVGQWAYFVGPEEFSQGKGADKEIYVFQEIDF